MVIMSDIEREIEEITEEEWKCQRKKTKLELLLAQVKDIRKEIIELESRKNKKIKKEENEEKESVEIDFYTRYRCPRCGKGQKSSSHAKRLVCSHCGKKYLKYRNEEDDVK